MDKYYNTKWSFMLSVLESVTFKVDRLTQRWIEKGKEQKRV